MADQWNSFLNQATAVVLKRVLNELNLPTSGSKSALKIRLQDAVAQFPIDRLLELIPRERNQNGDDNASGENEGHSDENYEDNDGESNDEQGEECTGSEKDDTENVDVELEKLRELLEKQKEISRLKKEIKKLQLEDIEVNSRSTGHTFKDMEDAIPTFSGDDNLGVERWLELFEETSEAMELNEKTKFIYGKRMMSGTAKIFLRTVSLKNWNDFKIKLRSEFKRSVTKGDVHNLLRQRKKKRDENLQQYVIAMQEIASASAIDEEDLVQYIVKGIQDSEVNKMLLYSANNLNELKIALRKYEKLKSNNNSDFHHKKYDHPEPKPGKHTIQKIRCFKCKEYGHVSRECPNNKRKPTMRGTTATTTSTDVMSLHQSSSSIETADNKSVNELCELSHHICLMNNNSFEHVMQYTFNMDNIECSMALLTLIDSGSPISFIQEKFVPRYATSAVSDQHSFHGINGSRLNIVGMTNCNIHFDNSFLKLNVFIVKDNTMHHSVILGRDYIEKNNMILKKKEKADNEITDDDQPAEQLISADASCSGETISLENNNESNFLQQILNINVSNENDLLEINLKINDRISFENKQTIQDMIKQVWLHNGNRKAFSTNNFEMNIKLVKEDPFYCVPRRLPYTHKIELQKILDDLLSRGIIRESSSPYSSPIVLVKKKNGEFRLCVDYRELNKYTVRDNYPLPLIEDHLDRLRGKKYFTTLDLKNGFHHVKLAEDSIKYTSFITPLGQYEYTRMPFGLKNAPSVFERFMKHIFGKLIQSENILTFIDDILIATETVEQHLKILKQVMDVIKENCLQLRLDKCSFLQNEIVYLGYKITPDGIRPSEEHLLAIKNFPVPKCTKDVQSFLGLCSYFRKFVKNFAIIAKPLYDLIKKDVPFVFGKSEFDTFECLRNKLIDSPVLCIYNPNSETELHCDASSIGFGAVLLQKQSDNKKDKIKEYLKICLKCIYFSPTSGKAEGVLHNIPKGVLPFDTLHIDHFGPLAISKTKKHHIFLVIDAFTKFVKLYPVRSTQSKEAIACLQSYFDNYSRPNRIISDRGTCFTSEEFAKFLQENNVQHIKIATQQPQANGQVERINRILTPMLAKMCDSETTSDWDKHLVRIEYAINNTINRSTGFSPSMLLFGTNQKGKLCDRVIEYLEDKLIHERVNLDSIRSQACQKIEKTQTYNKHYYDKNHKRPTKYKKGDYVMIKNTSNIPGVNKKLFARYRGPYEIDKVLSEDRYIIKDIEGMQITRTPYKGVCAPSNMRPFNLGLEPVQDA